MAGSKVTVQKPILFPRASDEEPKNEIKETSPFKIAPKNMKILGNKCNVTRETESHKARLREIRDDLNKCRDISFSRIGILHAVKMAILSTLICSYNIIPMEIPAEFFFFFCRKSDAKIRIKM